MQPLPLLIVHALHSQMKEAWKKEYPYLGQTTTSLLIILHYSYVFVPKSPTIIIFPDVW